jgi:allophanate hydrolase
VARANRIDLSLPLAGVPFAVKDNIDVAGMPTTAGCPSYAYTPDRTATIVTRLLEAGAILIGKTNMDQFATGLVGTRTPYGACSSVFDKRYISGGSSSGSAVAVAKQFCAFSLGTDTAGSGRVPAAFNALVGMKPTRGVLSTLGVVPACRSLDCVSIFAQTGLDALQVWNILQGFDPHDPYSRHFSPMAGAAPWLNGSFHFGVTAENELRFFGDTEAPRLYELAVHRLMELGGVPTTIDFTPFRAAADLLYQGPWVAERFAAVGKHIAEETSTVNSTVARIILSGAQHRAEDAYKALYRLEELKRAGEAQWARMDVMLLPTTGTIYTIDAVNADPVHLNSNLGYYTNFVNLMDLAAIALPAGFRTNGLPFGVSLIGRTFSDLALLELGRRFLGESSSMAEPSSGCIRLAVVGAHLEGQPLNWQLTQRGARLVKRCRTSTDYKLFALAGTTPPKPGLLRQPGYRGRGIEIEIWNIPEAEFGGFVAAVPEPLAIGNVQLDTGEWVKGFVCEPVALLNAEEITRYGGWRSYLSRGSSGSVEVSMNVNATSGTGLN